MKIEEKRIFQLLLFGVLCKDTSSLCLFVVNDGFRTNLRFKNQNSNYEIDHFRQGERDIGIFCTLSTGETSNLILIFLQEMTGRNDRVKCRIQKELEEFHATI